MPVRKNRLFFLKKQISVSVKQRSMKGGMFVMVNNENEFSKSPSILLFRFLP